jgi:iron complex outermembrane recepter protein
MQNKKGRLLMAFAIQCGLAQTVGWVSPVLAAEDNSAVPGAGGELQEIVVTAQKREENLQNVPITVTAISGDQLSASGIYSTQELGTSVPGLTLPNSSGYLLPHIRGIGTTIQGAGQENSVATYIDGVYIASPTAALFELDSIADVEVLKGPQGTLFGRNTTGGAILVNTKDPESEFSGKSYLSYGNYQTIDGNLYATGGLGDGVAANFAVNFSHMGEGYGTDFATGTALYRTTRDLSTRSVWKFAFGSDTSLRISMDYENVAGTMYSSNQVAMGTVPLLDPAQPLPSSPWDSYSGGVPYNAFQGGGASAKLDHDFGFAEFSSITAYRQSAFLLGFNGNLTPLPFIYANLEDDETQASQELQLQSSKDSSVKWIVGAYYFYDRGAYDPFRVSGLAFSSMGLGFTQTLGHQDVNAVAGYSQATIEVLPDTNLTLGARYSYEKHTLYAASEGEVGSTVIDLGPPVSNDVSYSKPTWRVSLDHQFKPDLMAYVSYNRGFKSGGFNVSVPTGPAFSPETLDAYEVGVKSQVFGDRLRLNSAAFFYNYTNIQVAHFLGLGIIDYYNGAAAHLYGLDLDMDAAVVDHLTVHGGFELIHDEFTSFPNAIYYYQSPTGGATNVVQSANGNYLPETPAATINLAADYTVPVEGGNIDLNLTYLHSAKWFSGPDSNLPGGQPNPSALYQPAYNLLNSSLTWHFHKNEYWIQAWGKNLTNAVVAFNVQASTLASEAAYQPPRTYGLTIGANF